MTDDAAPTVRLRPDVEWCSVGDEIVVLNLTAGEYVAIEGSAPALWPLVVAGATEDQLVDELLARYAIEHERARTDITAFLESLRTLRLVEDAR